MLFGEEGTGLTDKALKIADYCIEIPQYGSVRSLNVGTSSGILMYNFVESLKSSKADHTWLKAICDENDDVQSESYQLALLWSSKSENQTNPQLLECYKKLNLLSFQKIDLEI